jgi:hypothetical protein
MIVPVIYRGSWPWLTSKERASPIHGRSELEDGAVSGWSLAFEFEAGALEGGAPSVDFLAWVELLPLVF